MTTNEQNGHLVASRIEVEPTDRQRAAHKLVEAFGIAGEIDWTAVEANFRVLTETTGYESPVIATGRAAASRVNESLLAGQEPFEADLDAVRFALEQTRSAKPLELVDGIPARYWQGWLVENWLPRNCVAMLTGDGGVGKSRLALQLAWSLSGEGRWLGEAGQMPGNGADYGMGFEPLGPSTIVYATWEDSPEQIRGRLYWLEQAGKVGDGHNFKIADMRARGHLWASTQHNAVPGLTPAGETLRQAAEQHNARLLVVDTLGVANGASEIDRAQVGAFFRGLGSVGRRERLRRAADSPSTKDRGCRIFRIDGHTGRCASHVDHRECQERLPGRLRFSTELQMRTSLRLSPGERKAELQRGNRLDLAHEPTRRLAGEFWTKG